ncbi:MAG: prolyl oligopeptidase family serine peptidase [Bacteriovorax sp.]|nr:prolyl oligopeptidase family serine peptidase [Bacteriovorax sp.]
MISKPVNWSWYEPACWLCTAGIGKCSENSPDSDFQWNLSCGPDDPNKLDFTKSAWLISGMSIPANKRIEIEKYNGPIFITVGDQDEVWPVDQTRRIEATLKEAGKKPEIHYFPGEGHNFKGASELARKELVLDFLQRVSRP